VSNKSPSKNYRVKSRMRKRKTGEMLEAIQNLDRMAKTVNYNNWIYQLIQPFIGKRILEIGCGIGNMTRFFLDYQAIVAIDNSPECVEIMKFKFSHQTNLRVIEHDISDEKFGELKEVNFDTIVCINVLEHIEDDIQALRHCYQLLNEQGRIILFVPALKILYGTIDQADSHYRRYTKIELTDKLRKSGFIINKVAYANFFGIFPWVLHSKVLKKSIHPPKQMIFFDNFVPFFTFWERLFSPPIGLSLLFVGQKG